MKISSSDSWTDSFNFTNDLKLLEEVYQKEQKELVKSQREKAKEELAAGSENQPSPEPEDEQFLNQLSEYIANRLKDYLHSEEVLTHYSRLKELEEDNILMAQQIEQLLNHLELLHKGESLENQSENIENSSLLDGQKGEKYRHLFGNLYLKI